ncbi:MAG: phosphatase PAP2 family protein [Acidimicrobiia bacterium]
MIRPSVLVVATAVCGVLAGLVWHSRGPADWEQPVISLLQREPLPMARSIVLLWQPLPFAAATMGLAWKALTTDRVRLAISGTIGCVVALIVTERVLKPLVGRHHLHSGAAVFPSGHVTAAAAWAMFAWLVLDPRSRFRSVLVLVPVVVGWAVISAGMHYPADALAGLFIGGIVVYVVVVAVDRMTTTISMRGHRARATDEVYIALPADPNRTAVPVSVTSTREVSESARHPGY